MNVQPFNPGKAATGVRINVGATTANVQVATGGGYRQVRVMNDGTATAWIEFGASDVAAAVATGIPIGPGRDFVFTFPAPDGVLYMAAIAAGATGYIYARAGSGI